MVVSCKNSLFTNCMYGVLCVHGKLKDIPVGLHDLAL